MELICAVCRHEKSEHDVGLISTIPVCNLCRDLSLGNNNYHWFEPDSLSILEKAYEDKK